jgi:hypothetical protein
MLRLDWKLFVGVLIVFQLMFDLYAGLRLHTTYANASNLAILTAEYEAHLRTDQAQHKQMQDWLKTIDAALYAPIPEKPSPTVIRKPTAVETWQVNRDKELRERINRLEQWRLRMDRN